MNDLLDDTLARAGAVLGEDPELTSSLRDLASDRAGRGQRPRRRIRWSIGIGAGTTLALVGGGAALAGQWGPWTYVTDPDVVIAREWTDVDGVPLGSCETHVALQNLPADARAEYRAYFEELDLAAFAPNAERVAADLDALGRLDEIGRLVPGADPDEFDIRHEGDLWDAPWMSDARILQGALMQSVMRDAVGRFGESELVSELETQCTTDPAPDAP